MSNILIIAAHADDEVLGCGGTIARHAQAGDDVHVIIVGKGVPEVFPPEYVAEVLGEAKAASDVLGVKALRCLGFPVPRLDTVPTHEIADALHSIVRTLKPSIVYVPHHGDLHGDHKATFWATLVACRPQGELRGLRVQAYETLSETNWAAPISAHWFIPTVFVDISDTLDRKLKAMACYRTQLKASPHPRSLEALEALARLRGASVGLPAAEAFTLLRELV